MKQKDKNNKEPVFQREGGNSKKNMLVPKPMVEIRLACSKNEKKASMAESQWI